MNSADESLVPLAHPIKNACQRVGLGRTAFYALISSGEIRTFKIGTRTLVPESELQKLVDRCLEAAT